MKIPTISVEKLKNINPKKGIIVSFPRSGLNWVRYCIEYFSGLRTAGNTKIHKEGKLAVYRTHNVLHRGHWKSCHCAFFDEKGKPLHNKVILLIRDYRESFIRIAKKKLGRIPTAEEIGNGQIFHFRDYFENLKAYDEFSGKKRIIYYHDLVKDFSEMKKILNFLNISYNLKNFDLEYHREQSIDKYNTDHKSHTAKDLYNFTFHQEQVDPEVLKALDEFVDANYKELADKYLR